LAREGTTSSATLLKNDNDILPLNPLRNYNIAVIGPNAMLSQEMAGINIKLESEE
jgi:beta-glucosidase-like glycosyl hydrolase